MNAWFQTFTCTLIWTFARLHASDPANEHPDVHTLTGHRGEIASIAFSPDGKLLASGGTFTGPNERYGEVILWDTQTGKLQQKLPVPCEVVESVAFSPDGRTLAIGGGTVRVKDRRFIARNEVLLFDRHRWKLKRSLTGHSNYVYEVVFSPDGKYLATGSAVQKGSLFVAAELRFWDVRTGKLKWVKSPLNEDSFSLAFSPDGRFLANQSMVVKKVMLRTALSGVPKRTLAVPGPQILMALAFSPKGDNLAAGGMGFEPDAKSILDLAQEPQKGEIPHLEMINRTAATLWNIRTCKLLRTFTGHGKILHSVAFSPDGKWLAGGGEREVKGGFLGVGIRDLTREQADKLKVSSGVTVERVVKASPAEQAGIQVDDVLSKLEREQVSDAHQFTTQIRKRKSGDKVMLDLLRGTDVIKITVTLGEKDVSSGIVELWDVQTGKLKQSLMDHQGTVRSVSFSPDGEILASGSKDGTIRLWKLRKLK